MGIPAESGDVKSTNRELTRLSRRPVMGLSRHGTGLCIIVIHYHPGMGYITPV